MGKYEHFEDVPVWQEAKRLYNAVLDLLEKPKIPLSAGFREQLDRAALSVSSNIAEGFEHSAITEARYFIGIACESSGQVRSMTALVQDRPKLKRIAKQLKAIRGLAESCAQQLKNWHASSEASSGDGEEQLSEKERQALDFAQRAKDLRLSFLRGLQPDHPLYNSPEAQAARGEPEA